MITSKFIGIDPGLTGAIGVIDLKNECIRVIDLPTLVVGKKRELDVVALVQILKDEILGSSAVVGLEKVGAMPKQGLASTASFMRAAGILEGAVAALGARYELVTPQRWKKNIMEGMAKEKEASRLKASQLFPEIDLSLKKHHGRADALLIAEFMRRLYGNRHYEAEIEGKCSRETSSGRVLWP